MRRTWFLVFLCCLLYACSKPAANFPAGKTVALFRASLDAPRRYPELKPLGDDPSETAH
jgi:hypothetical protein